MADLGKILRLNLTRAVDVDFRKMLENGRDFSFTRSVTNGQRDLHGEILYQ